MHRIRVHACPVAACACFETFDAYESIQPIRTRHHTHAAVSSRVRNTT